MPVEQQKTIAGYWRDVAEKTGAEFNFDFWQRCQPRRSTYPACRAVLAGRLQDVEQGMIDAIQQAYYLRALNPSDNDTVIALASEWGLNETQFAEDLVSQRIQHELEEEFALRRRPGFYSFPSLVLEHGETLYPLEINYLDYQSVLDAIRSKLESSPDHTLGIQSTQVQ